VRLSVGAVSVTPGNFCYFDTSEPGLDVRHVMASGALPPGFPPIEIDGEFYWDGGLVSNTPLQYVLDEPAPARAGVPGRPVRRARRDAGHARRGERAREGHPLLEPHAPEHHLRAAPAGDGAGGAAARRRLPASLRDDPDARLLAAIPCEARVDVVHLIYRSKHYESQSKDYEFSRASMLEHWAAGLADTQRPRGSALARPRSPRRGVHVFDLASASPTIDQDHHSHHRPQGRLLSTTS
jgi:NTE family protein